MSTPTIKESHLKKLIWESFRAMKKCELDYGNKATHDLEAMCSIALAFDATNLLVILETISDIAKNNNEFELVRQLNEEMILIAKLQRRRRSLDETR